MRQTLDPDVTTLLEQIHAQAAAQPAPQTPRFLKRNDRRNALGSPARYPARRGLFGSERFCKCLLRDHCIHWFAMAHRRYIEATAGPDGWMAIAFLFLSCEVAPHADTSDQQGIRKIGPIFEFIAALPPWMASRTAATS